MDRRTFLRRSAAAGVALTGVAGLLGSAGCSSAPPTCGLGCAGDTASLESAIGHRLKYERIYHRTEPFPDAQEQAAWAARRIPVTSFKTLQDDGSAIPFAEVAAGADDDHLRALAAAIRPFGRRPWILIYFAEPEDDVGESPEDFAPAFRRVRDVMGDLGPGITWAHNVSHGTYDDGDGELYYPGDDYVDYIACDGYNWCPGSGHGTEKETFERLFAVTNQFAERKGKPWLATEVGTWDDPTPGWSKAEWIEQMGRTAKAWARLKGIMWFEHDSDESTLCDWKIQDRADAIEAFAALARDPYFGG